MGGGLCGHHGPYVEATALILGEDIATILLPVMEEDLVKGGTSARRTVPVECAMVSLFFNPLRVWD